MERDYLDPPGGAVIVRRSLWSSPVTGGSNPKLDTLYHMWYGHSCESPNLAEPKRLPAAFYRSPSGREPVRERLLGLDEKSRRIVGRDIATAEFGWPLGMPLCRHLGGGLQEVRSSITEGRIARVIFVVYADQMVLLGKCVRAAASWTGYWTRTTTTSGSIPSPRPRTSWA